MRSLVASAFVLRLLMASSLAGADRPNPQGEFSVGSVYQCRLSHGVTLTFDEKGFTQESANDNVGMQIRILRKELEMTLATPTGEIYVEKDSIVSRTGTPSVFAIYRAPIGNVVSLALHALPSGEIIFTQSKTYQLSEARPNLYQAMYSGKCRRL